MIYFRFEVLPKIYKERPSEFAKFFAFYLSPKTEDFEYLEKNYKILLDNADKDQLMMIKQVIN